MDLLIGLDLGTSAIKGVLVSSEGELLARERCATRLNRPAPGRVEFSAEDYFESVCEILRRLAGAAPAGANVKALSMAAASGNTLLLDEEGRPLGPAISWMDERACGEAGLLPGIDTAGVHEVVGWPWSGLFPLAHLAWLRRHEPATWARARVYAMNLTHVLHALCGELAVDPSTATTFYLQDQAGNCWHRPFLDALGIDESALPARGRSGAVLGRLTPDAADRTSLPADTPVVLGAFDHPCAARGTGVLRPGDMLLSCGTSWVGFYPIAERRLGIANRLLVDPFLAPDGPWAAMFSLPRIGVAVDTYIDRLVISAMTGEAPQDRYATFNEQAARSPAGANGLTLDLKVNPEPAPAHIERITRAYTPADAARAVMESLARALAERLRQLAQAGMTAEKITMVGGPAESPVWPQIVADITGLTLHLFGGQHAGALGAAVLAGIGAGLYANEAEGAAQVAREPVIVRPDPRAQAEYERLLGARGRQAT
ncbi:MAG: hypothetical protein JXR37_31285 [Kiritimatiellae bacterium]|nr:hypothetical protein [Kiritimatiellia bacterium]